VCGQRARPCGARSPVRCLWSARFGFRRPLGLLGRNEWPGGEFGSEQRAQKEPSWTRSVAKIDQYLKNRARLASGLAPEQWPLIELLTLPAGASSLGRRETCGPFGLPADVSQAVWPKAERPNGPHTSSKGDQCAQRGIR